MLPPSDFRTLKNVQAITKEKSVVQAKVTDSRHCSYCECSKCPPSAATQDFSRFENSLTACLIDPWGRLSEITCRTSSVLFGDHFGFRMALVIGLQHCPGHGNPRGSSRMNLEATDLFGNEIWAVGLEPVLRGTSCVLARRLAERCIHWTVKIH